MHHELITTKRLALRPWNDNDLDALHALLIDADVRRYLCDDEIYDRAKVAGFIAESQATFDERQFGFWRLAPREARNDAPLVGFCGLRLFDEGREVELMYALAPAHWHRGLATEAAEAVLRYGFTQLTLERIWARTDPPNLTSVEVMKRLGLEPVDPPPPGSEATVCYLATREWLQHAN